MSKLLDILLQRNDAAVGWEFRVRGGRDYASQPIISDVTSGTLASQYLEVGDKLLEIEKLKADSLLQSEINGLIENKGPCLQLLVEKRPISATETLIPNGSRKIFKSEIKNRSYETGTEEECVREKDGVKQHTKIWLKEKNKNAALGEYDLEVNFQRTKFRHNDEVGKMLDPRGSEKNINRERMRVMSENFDKVFRQKIGEWLEENVLTPKSAVGKQQPSVMSPTENDTGSAQTGPPPPPPPPSFPGVVAGRRLKTEIPQRIVEPPAAIQNAMLTKDKKPFTYTPGGIDLSEIRSPRMARRINRNAQAEEMPGIPAPTTNHHVTIPQVDGHSNGSVNYSAMQSQLPSQVLPPVKATSPLPPPPPPPPSSEFNSMQQMHQPRNNCSGTSTASPQTSKISTAKPGLLFDPNELLARVNKSPAYEPNANQNIDTCRSFKNQQPAEEKIDFLKQQRPKSTEIDQNIYAPLKSPPVQSYSTSTAPKLRNEPGTSYIMNQPSRNQSTSTPLSPSAKSQETTSPLVTQFGNKIQQSQSPTSPPIGTYSEIKSQVPWATVYQTPQTSVPLTNRGPEPSKSGNTRIIPIQVEGASSPTSPKMRSTPPAFMQSPQVKQQYATQQSQQTTQQSSTQNHQVRQQFSAQEQQSPNVRVIPVQVEGGAGYQTKSPMSGMTQNKFNPMSPTSPTPYSPTYEKDQKPQWASVQSKPFKKEPERLQQQQHQHQQMHQSQMQSQSTYNTVGVPLSQLKKMQLTEDDRALMDKFKSQVKLHGNDILNDENTNPRYKGGYIPSRMFKMLDECVDDETYLHRESDPRYRGAVIPSRAFRILQSMTDTAGDMQQSVSRSPPQTTACKRPFAGTQYYQEPSQGLNVPPSEQQVQEPRKYTGGSIPSRSFRMLQAMTGQEVSASKSSRSTMRHETSISDMNRCCSSPSPSLPGPFWNYCNFSHPCFVHKYFHDLNDTFDMSFLPPPRPLTPFFNFQRSCGLPPFMGTCSNDVNDNDEPSCSYSDELAEYYSNYKTNMGYCSYHSSPGRFHPPTPIPFKVSRACGTSKIKRKECEKKSMRQKLSETLAEGRIQKNNGRQCNINEKVRGKDEEDYNNIDNDERSEVEDYAEEKAERPVRKLNGLLSMKSISNLNLYTAKNFSDSLSVGRNHCHTLQGEVKKGKEKENGEMLEGEEEDQEEEEDTSTTESFDDSVSNERSYNHLSVIFEESESSESESFTYQGSTNSISTSESCSTIGNDSVKDGSTDEDISTETVPSITVRLPSKAGCSHLNSNAAKEKVNNDSLLKKEDACNVNQNIESCDLINETDNESSDFTVTFTLPSRSNSVVSTCDSTPEERNNYNDTSYENRDINLKEPEVETVVTIRLGRPKEPKNKTPTELKTEKSESPQTIDDSNANFQGNQTILIYNDTGKEEEKEKQMKGNHNFGELDGDKAVEVWANERGNIKRPEDGRSTLQNLVSIENQSINSISEKDIKKKGFMEESEEDDSGVTSDMSLKHNNSETDGETESDYSELSKMTQFQRASTHSRLYKLLQEEYEKSEKMEEKNTGKPEENAKEMEKEFNLMDRKPYQPLQLTYLNHDETKISSKVSDIISPSSSSVTDQLVKELIHSLLKMKGGKKFKKLSLAKLYQAALKILEEEMGTCEEEGDAEGETEVEENIMGLDSVLGGTSSSFSHSKGTVPAAKRDALRLSNEASVDGYMRCCKCFKDFDNGDPMPSRTFRISREKTSGPAFDDGLRIKCPRAASEKTVREPVSGRSTPVLMAREPEPKPESLSFVEKQKIVAKVFERY